jgi:hypothetical protein
LLYRNRSRRNTNGRHTAPSGDARNEQKRDGVDVAAVLDRYLATREETRPQGVERCESDGFAA